MSDFDYGRENRLWGEDGIPYGLDNDTDYVFVQMLQTIAYNKSELRAIGCGFEVVADEKAYNGRYFVKDNLLWIHEISSLKKKVGVSDNEELFRMGYDVETFFELAS